MQLWAQREDPLAFALVVLGLGTADTDTLAGPVHVLPAKPQRLRWCAKAAPSGESDDAPPIMIDDRFEQTIDLLRGDVVHPIAVALRASLYALEGSPDEQFPTHGFAEEHSGDSDFLRDLGRCVVATNEPSAPGVCVLGADVRENAVTPEVLDEEAFGLTVPGAC